MGQPHPASEPANPHRQQPKSPLPMQAAERELGAFLAAVRQNFGAAAAPRAADYWLEAFNAAPAGESPSRTLQRVTIRAASRLARDAESGSRAKPYY